MVIFAPIEMAIFSNFMTCVINNMPIADILQFLQVGTLEAEGLLPWSSNYTFLMRVCTKGRELTAVYKPQRGERPLWDFAQGTLCLREEAAFLVSDNLGWHLVPPTITREGPHGLGSLQLYIEHDPEYHYFTFEGDPRYQRQLQQTVLFDVLINNADRKSGHVLVQTEGDETLSDRIWAIDHGVCFHTDHKLRTVIWEFAGTRIPSDLIANLKRFQADLYANPSTLTQKLRQLLSNREISALKKRLNSVLEQGKFPAPGPGRHYPWPPV